MQKHALEKWPALLLMGLGYFAWAWASVELSRQPGNFAVLWFANAWALGIILSRPRSDTLMLLAVQAVSNAMVSILYGDPIWLLLAFSACNAIEVAVAAALLSRFGNAQRVMSDAWSFVRVLTVGTVAPAALGATLGSAVLSAAGLAPMAVVWPGWFLGDVFGYLAFASAMTFFLYHRTIAPVEMPTSTNILIVLIGLGVGYVTLAHFDQPYSMTLAILVVVLLRAPPLEGALANLALAVVIAYVKSTQWAREAASGNAHLNLIDEVLPPLAVLLVFNLLLTYSKANKLANAALEQRERFIRSVTDGVPGMVGYWDSNQINRFANKAYLDWFGKTPQEIAGIHISDLLGPDLYNKDRPFIESALNGKYQSFTRTLTKTNGSNHSTKAEYIPDIVGGHVAGFIVMVTDVTEIVQARENVQASLLAAEKQATLLQKAQENLAEAQRIARLGSWRLDFSTGDVSWSEELHRIFGTDPSKPPPSYAVQASLFTPESWATLDAAVTAAINTGEPYELELQIHRVDGTLGWLLARGERLLDASGQPQVLQGVAMDITERKATELAMEQLRQTAEIASQAKSDFLANMSHEIRTPMNAVMGIAYLLEKAELDTQSKQLVRKLRTSGRMLQRILDDILDFSKIEAGALSLESIEFDLQDVLNNVSVIMESMSGGKDIEMAISPPPFGMHHLLGDPTRLDQVLMNLVVNAVKFTEAGHVAVRVTCTEQTNSAVTLLFEVEDTGIGMSPDQVARLFQPFMQADVSTSRKFGGTGLGLTICKKLLEMMGSTLQVQSALGQGSRFYFELTLQRGMSRAELADELKELDVVIADDSEISREALRATAKSLGWNPTLVEDGAQAVKHVVEQGERESGQQVIILDWKMPVMDGLQAARTIHESNRGDAGPIIVVATAYSRDELVEHPDIRYTDAVLVKPVTVSMLFDAVGTAYRQRKGQHAATTQRRNDRRRLEGLRLLVVDDSDVNLEVAKSIFEGEGASVEVRENGQQAVDWLVQNPLAVDLVLMDIQMPVLDGYGAMALIRKHAHLSHIPVVALTAGVLATSRNAVYASGMVGHIAKPMNVEVAIRTILQVVNAARVDSDALQDRPNTVQSDQYLPGLKVGQAIDVWRDESRYRQYLASFKDKYANWLERVDGSNDEQLTAFAHKLCGSAGNLGLTEVSEAASAVEMAIANHQDVGSFVATLKRAMETGLDSIRQYLDAHKSATQVESGRADPQKISSALRSAYDALETISPDTIEPLLQDLLSTLEAAHKVPAQQAMEAVANFDFRSARAALERLAVELKLELPDAQ